MKRLSLGLDISTQSISAVVLDIDSQSILGEYSIDYRRDGRLNRFGINEDYILPPTSEGEANQPAAMFFAALDAMFTDLKDRIDLEQIAVINTSGQQHGHVYLNSGATTAFSRLHIQDCEAYDLVDMLNPCLAWEAAPIWMTSNTGEQSEFIRNYVGGKRRVIELSGADAPLRFTGSVIRHTGQAYPEVYRNTTRIQLISSLIPAILTANPDVPADYGNASGMTLMDYRKKAWSNALLRAASDGLDGSAEGLRSKLPDLVSPDAPAGKIALYFTRKYGFSPDCLIIAGSGDNPQSKVLVTGDLLSLGTSIVNMVSTDGETLDLNGYASAMYDGLGRPFMFGTRTNGVLLWDRLRAMYDMEKQDYVPAEEALRKMPVAKNLLFWQSRRESFPPSESIDITRVGGFAPKFDDDYSALIETTLAFVYAYSKGFSRETGDTLYVTGGARKSREILRRVAAIWNRPVAPIEAGGAALGSAVAGVSGYLKSLVTAFDAKDYTAGLLKREEAIMPVPADVRAFHAENGFLNRFREEEKKIFG